MVRAHEHEHEQERVLADRLQRGDASALADLYDLHASTMLALGARVLGSVREAEDVVHDVFLEAWAHVREYEPSRGTVRAWLMMRMRSRALDRRGSAGFSRVVSLTEAHDREDAKSGSSHDPERLAVRTAIGLMEKNLREILHLTYFAGMTATEIGTALDIPLGTVRSRLARGLSILEAALKDPPT